MKISSSTTLDMRSLEDLAEKNDLGSSILEGIPLAGWSGSELDLVLGIPAEYERKPATKSRVMAAASEAFAKMQKPLFGFSELGEGAFSHVFSAGSIHYGKVGSVAVKVLKYSCSEEDTRRINMFARDANIHSEIAGSPLNLILKRVPFVYDFGRISRAYTIESCSGEERMALYYMVTEHVEGRDLADALSSPDTPPDKKKIWLRQAAEAMCIVHDAGYVHRDIKPSNFLNCYKNGVMLTDFGLSVKKGEYVCSAAGTPRYMAPESVFPAAIMPSLDVFAFGIMLYESFECGAHPLKSGGYMAPSSRELSDSGLGMIASKCLEKYPDKRYRSGLELLNAFDSIRF